VGGAAVWSFIQQSDLPSNLQADVGSPPGNDLNNATSSGWYAFTNTTANTPTTANQVGHVIVTSVYGGNIKQNLWDYFSNQQFVRSRNSALAWTSWVRADLLPRLIASAQLTGTITYSGSGPQVLGALPSAAYNGQQVELFATLGLASTGAAQTGQLWWGESGSPITNVHYFYVVGGGAANIVEVPLRTLVTPSAGNHTYQVLWSGGTNLVVDAANYTTPILTARYV
jgi:hypothetical protein